MAGLSGGGQFQALALLQGPACMSPTTHTRTHTHTHTILSLGRAKWIISGDPQMTPSWTCPFQGQVTGEPGASPTLSDRRSQARGDQEGVTWASGDGQEPTGAP